ncbi:uncharacterized protein CIMG_10470 [Coccidioides immitis RS]|uniref:Uncharacterized protein n=3 Tax=Coccidioides immitis TaxID=5501 RepID=A0A0D8JTC6_COCIM|nr:uncharacterized protein CIMG_10470 [Coccidioides immitis RS]KJF60374.1 hypothetical protein CIMG_10470 [Coccidioides immitis RS]TPX26911.1 hypothetical protein DIZ76_012375 [Coccidioides immitis]
MFLKKMKPGFACAMVGIISIQLSTPGAATPLKSDKTAIDALAARNATGLPSHVTIECISGQCSERDRQTLAQVLDMIENDPAATQGWNITSFVEIENGPAKHEKYGISLARRQDAVKNETDLIDLDLAMIHHCIATNCSSEALDGMKHEMSTSTLRWLWPILGRLKGFKFNYGLEYTRQ